MTAVREVTYAYSTVATTPAEWPDGHQGGDLSTFRTSQANPI